MCREVPELPPEFNRLFQNFSSNYANRNTDKPRHIGIWARGLGAAAPQTQAKPLFFRQKLNFSHRSQQPKMKKKHSFVFIKRKKTEFVVLSEIKCGARNPGFLLIINGWDESGKVILQVSISVFFGRCRKNFRAKMAQPPYKKLAHTVRFLRGRKFGVLIVGGRAASWWPLDFHLRVRWPHISW